jgi:CubicO group peptidase (beta-lactamase class C family)
VLTLDDPVARWLPEAASPRVLVSPGAPLDHTTDATRPITVRHLLTLTCGWGAVLEETPLQAAMVERGVYPGPLTPQMSGDEFVARVAGLPLAFQPGEGWLYDTGIDLLGVLLARAAGKPLSHLVAERITGPLGMTATGVDAEAAEAWMAPGRWGWDGGTGTTAHVDPTRGIVGVLLTQRMMTGPLDGFGDFWTAMAAAA